MKSTMKEKPFHTYIIISQSSEKIYIGHTDNLKKRIIEHNTPDNNAFTSKEGPWKLIYSEQFEDRSKAMHMENYIKRLKNKKYILEKYCNIKEEKKKAPRKKAKAKVTAPKTKILKTSRPRPIEENL